MFQRAVILLLFSLLTLRFFHITQSASAAAPSPAITAPAAGQAILGVIEIIGNTQVDGFASAELAFAYPPDPTQTWFLIAEMNQPQPDGLLARWDTTGLTDGNYTLKLSVTRNDGTRVETLVDGLRVRNYSPVETSTPQPTATPTVTPTPDPASLPTPSATPTASPTPPRATATPFPPNPVELTPPQIGLAIARGVALAAGIFTAIALYRLFKRLARKSIFLP